MSCSGASEPPADRRQEPAGRLLATWYCIHLFCNTASIKYSSAAHEPEMEIDRDPSSLAKYQMLGGALCTFLLLILSSWNCKIQQEPAPWMATFKWASRSYPPHAQQLPSRLSFRSTEPTSPILTGKLRCGDPWESLARLVKGHR
jgi:hypothetical protein